MYNVVRPSDKVKGGNNFKGTNNVPSIPSKRLSRKHTNQLSENEENREDSFEECESYSNDARPSLNPRFDYSFE